MGVISRVFGFGGISPKKDYFDLEETLYNLVLKINYPDFSNLSDMQLFSERIKLFDYLIGENTENWEDAFSLRTHVRRDGLILPDFEDGLKKFNAGVDIIGNEYPGTLENAHFYGRYSEGMFLHIEREIRNWKDVSNPRLYTTPITTKVQKE